MQPVPAPVPVATAVLSPPLDALLSFRRCAIAAAVLTTAAFIATPAPYLTIPIFLVVTVMGIKGARIAHTGRLRAFTACNVLLALVAVATFVAVLPAAVPALECACDSTCVATAFNAVNTSYSAHALEDAAENGDGDGTSSGGLRAGHQGKRDHHHQRDGKRGLHDDHNVGAGAEGRRRTPHHKRGGKHHKRAHDTNATTAPVRHEESAPAAAPAPPAPASTTKPDDAPAAPTHHKGVDLPPRHPHPTPAPVPAAAEEDAKEGSLRRGLLSEGETATRRHSTGNDKDGHGRPVLGSDARPHAGGPALPPRGKRDGQQEGEGTLTTTANHEDDKYSGGDDDDGEPEEDEEEEEDGDARGHGAKTLARLAAMLMPRRFRNPGSPPSADKFARFSSRVCESGPAALGGAGLGLLLVAVVHLFAARASARLASHPWFQQQSALRRARNPAYNAPEAIAAAHAAARAGRTGGGAPGAVPVALPVYAPGAVVELAPMPVTTSATGSGASLAAALRSAWEAGRSTLHSVADAAGRRRGTYGYAPVVPGEALQQQHDDPAAPPTIATATTVVMGAAPAVAGPLPPPAINPASAGAYASAPPMGGLPHGALLVPTAGGGYAQYASIATAMYPELAGTAPAAGGGHPGAAAAYTYAVRR